MRPQHPATGRRGVFAIDYPQVSAVELLDGNRTRPSLAQPEHLMPETTLAPSPGRNLRARGLQRAAKQPLFQPQPARH